MDEISLVATIAQVSHTGLSLSLRFHPLVFDYLNAKFDQIAHKILAISAILSGLGDILADDNQNWVASHDCTQNVREVVNECSQIFSEIISELNTVTGKSNRVRISKEKRSQRPSPKVELVQLRLGTIAAKMELVLRILQYATKRKQ